MTLAQALLNPLPMFVESALGPLGQVALSLVRARLANINMRITTTRNNRAEIVDEYDIVRRSAQKFVFEVNAPSLVDQWCDAGRLVWSEARESLRLPAPVCWLEWPTDEFETGGGCARMGVLIDTYAVRETAFRRMQQPYDLGRGYVPEMVLVFCAMDKLRESGEVIVTPAAMTFSSGIERINEMGADGDCAEIIWFCAQDQPDGPQKMPRSEWRKTIGLMSRDLFSALFLLSVPKVCETRDQIFHPKQQAKRRNAGKPPLIEFKRVHVVVGQGSPKYAGGADRPASGEHHGKKLHHVMPFFRTYRKGREKPRTVLVTDHWRGDPRLGLVVKERHVHAPRAKG